MKFKFKYLIFTATAALTLTSCGFENIFEVRLKSLSISDSVGKVYVVGESYFDFADLTIKGTYSDNTTEIFERTDVSFTLTSDGEQYDISSPFSAAGNYSLRASKDGVKSNTLKIKVLATPEYVTSLTPTGPNTVAINKTIDVSLNIAPSNYTVLIEASIVNDSIAQLTKVNDSSYKVKGLSIGETDITFRSHSSETEYISATHHISVTENYATSITATGPSTVARESTVVINLAVDPDDFSVPVTATANNSNVTIEKVDNTKFRVTGNTVGTSTITFSAASSATTFVTTTHDIEVLNIVKTNILETYNDLSKHSFYPVSACPTEGDVKLLVIPVWFTDSESFVATNKKEQVRSDIETAYFGSTSETGWHSVSSFYREESSGSLNMTGSVSNWYNAGVSSDTASQYGDSGDSRQGNLVKAATDWYFQNNSSDNRRNYDSDGDGYLDGVMLIYAAPDHQVYSYPGDNLWAYCFWVQDTSQKSTTNPGVNVYFWASYDFMYNTSLASSHTGHNYANGDCSHCNIDAHTFIHEMGHVFGLEDYYDYAGATSPAAGFSMQDYNIGGHDAFSVMSLGWADPYIPTSTCEITINDFQSSKDMILLSPQWNTYNSPFDEYLLLELYSPTGLNAFDSTYSYSGGSRGPNTAGIRLWHVDARLVNTSRSFTKTTTGSRVAGAFNNTSDSEVRECTAGEEYQEYNLLQLIRYNSSSSFLTSNDLFKSGSSFSMSAFSSQFVDGPKLDIDNKNLGWTFSVDSITQNTNGTYSATITVTKVS